MTDYKKVTTKDVEIFLSLYKKYLFIKIDEMKNILETLPTDVIERCFNGAEFFKEGFDTSKIEVTQFGINGLCGWSKVEEVSDSLKYCSDLHGRGKLAETLERLGHKVNFKRVGVSI